MLDSSPIARLMVRVRIILVLAALALLGMRRASAGIETSPDFPLDPSKSESSTGRLLAMYRKDVGMPTSSGKESPERPAVRRAVVDPETK